MPCTYKRQALRHKGLIAFSKIIRMNGDVLKPVSMTVAARKTNKSSAI